MAADYIGAIVILVVSILKVFGIIVSQDVITGLVTGVIALYLAFKRHGNGDITAFGVKRA